MSDLELIKRISRQGIRDTVLLILVVFVPPVIVVFLGLIRK
jgi:hypothetical protein